MNKLIESLNKINKDTHVFHSSSGSKVLLMPYGARIIGLYPDKDDENFFWTNKDLYDETKAREVFREDKWQNSGGDRTWISPELDIFFPDYPEAQNHWEPPQIDASEYEVITTDKSVIMQKSMELFFARPERNVSLNLSKEITYAENPLRFEKGFQKTHTGVSYAGYTLKCTLKINDLKPNDSVNAAIWNLAQLPHGGELLIPTYHKEQPLVLFGDIPAEKLISEDRSVRFIVDFPGEHKIAVRAVSTTGRTGYIFEQGDKWNLVIRNFFVNPSGFYVDVPKFKPDDPGYSVNAVNVKSGLGDFCEMEYHVPAAGSAPGTDVSVDTSQIWAYRGVKKSIEQIADFLL